MKDFQSFQLSLKACFGELKDFRDLLSSSPRLREREHLLPFFKSHMHLSLFMGSYFTFASECDLVAHEYDLFGDFICDVAIGSSRAKAYAFIEFEDAAPNSVFVRRPQKSSPEWAPRLEHGFSQVVDWFYKLADQEGTDDYLNRFGDRSVEYFGLLVVGRSEPLGERERRRLKWREEKTLINSHKVRCVTFDQLYNDLSLCAESLKRLAEVKRRRRK